MSILHSAINFATNNKWIATMPIESLSTAYGSKKMAFNLTSFELPEMLMSSSTLGFYGSQVEVPTLVRSQQKTILFNYLLSSDWHQWKLLYAWFSKFAVEEGSGTAPSTNVNEKWFLPISVIMLSEFKKPIFEIKFFNCWIKSFGSVSCDYQDAEASVIKHSFTIAYSYFTFSDLMNLRSD